MRFLFVIWMLLRRIISQWRLELCLLVGLLAAMAVVTAVPIYTGGALQNSFLKKWQESSVEQPGIYTVNLASNQWFITGKPDIRKFLSSFAYLQKCRVAEKLQLPVLASGWYSSLSDQMELPNPDGAARDPLYAGIITMTGLDPLVRLVDGRMPSVELTSEGVVETACTQMTADALGLLVGQTYNLRCALYEDRADGSWEEPTVTIRLRLVGTFELRRDRLQSLTWFARPNFTNSLFIQPGIFMDYLAKKRKLAVEDLVMTWVMDYRKARVQNLSRMVEVLNSLERAFRLHDQALVVTTSPLDIFTRFLKEKEALEVMMLTLTLPTLLLILYYICLAAGLIVGERRGEIAMLKSRGAGTFQLTGTFILEWSILALGCLVAGPPLGLFFAQIVGASAGFLNFVDRQALPVAMTTEAYLYAVILAALMIIAAAVPAFKACRHSIVEHKQSRSRDQSKPFWQRFYIDLLLCGAGLYGYRLMLIQTAAGQQSAISELLIDPFLFLVPMLLAVACGLLLLRLLPLITGVMEFLTNRGRGVALYTSLVEVSRNISRYRSLVLLVVLTTAMGIYGAAMARTLDRNTQDRVYYATGADVVLQEQWFRLVSSGIPFAPPKLDTSRPFEPPFLVHRKLPGVLAAARVQTTPKASVTFGSKSCMATVMAIDPFDFGQTAWFRPQLTPLHQNSYLNLLAGHPKGAIVTRDLLADGVLKLGDSIAVDVNNAIIDFTVLGAVDYWPTLYKDKEPFVIVNLSYVTEQSNLLPYDVWLKLKPHVKLTPILKMLQKNGIAVSKVTDARNELILARRDPQKMGFYGLMSIGFCVAVLITVIGYFLYTFILIRNRLLQFGVLRAIGLSLGQLVNMICLEQLWSTGLGLFAGTVVGWVISIIFVPFIRTATAMTGEIPPFRVIVSASDIGVIYSLLLPALLIAVVALAFILARLQVHQAVKMGEES